MNRLICQTFLSFICYTLGHQTTEVNILFIYCCYQSQFLFLLIPQSFKFFQNPNTIGTGLIPDQNDALLMFSTLDGSLIAVEQKTGDIRWHQNDGKYFSGKNHFKEILIATNCRRIFRNIKVI